MNMAGNITIIEPRDNFQKVSRDVILNPEVDVFTLGVYVKVLCLGVKWKMNVPGLAKALGCSADRIRKAFSTLESTGYLRRVRIKGDHGHFTGWDYEVSSEPLTDIAKTPTSENTDVGEIRTSETPKYGEMPRISIDIKENIETKNKNTEDISIPPYPPTKSSAFSLRSALIAAGVSADVADAWLAVRKAKRAVNTEVAWRAIEREISRSGRSANDCIRFAVERSWAGFKADWLNEESTKRPTPTAPSHVKGNYVLNGMRILDSLQGTNYYEQYMATKNGTTLKRDIVEQ